MPPGNFDDAVRALPPTKTPILCEHCGRLIPFTGDEAHRVSAVPDGESQRVVVTCDEVARRAPNDRLM